MKKTFLPILITCFLLISLTCRSQQTMNASQAYDIAQKARSDAEDLWDKKGATPAEVAKSIQILKNALIFLDSVPVKRLAEKNIYLRFRRNDVTRDLARVYAASGQKELALVTLEQWYKLGNSSGVVSFITDDSAFLDIRQEPQFQKIVNNLKEQGMLWQNTAFNTPYKPDLTEDEKIAGLTLLWSQAKFNFVHFDHLSIDWNQTYIDYLAKVRNTKSTAEYYKVLISFYAQLKDGHTNVNVPKELSADFYSRPPMRTELIEGRVFITNVFSDSLVKTGIKPGLEILKIDSEPVVSYAEKNVKPYQSSSTPQDLEVREFTYSLISGPANKPVLFELKDRNGKIFTQSVARSGYHDIVRFKSIEYQAIGDIGYLVINNFEDRTINKKFDSLFTQIAKTKGLIIDIRYNGGGDGGIGFGIISKLTNKPFKTSSAKIMEHYSTPDAEAEWQEIVPGEDGPNGKLYYDKPVVLLIGPRTFSAAEDFTVAFSYMKRGKLVGMPTGGSTGQPVGFNLPGGGSARVCGKWDYFPDGKEFVGVGIMPDVTVKKTVKDLLNGTDAAKNKALELLKD
jgi:carboxyl-terminal processing protease